ncbi:MAG: hypothetical protein JEZ00_18240 [Anaerolineaceae bacterium]|nr:hypothetical protein [Anaerolineaceae bacterium]
MQGIFEEQVAGNKRIQIGTADQKTVYIFYAVAIPILLALAVWIYQSLTQTNWQVPQLVIIYLLATLFYLNVGVWLHEQLHCLGFRGTVNEANTTITYERKFGLILTGFYRVKGDIECAVIQRALLMPLWLSAGFILLGILGMFFLPDWWLPVMLTLALGSMFDMIHDVYMVSQIRKIGKQGVYQDHGHYLEVIIKA